MGVSGKMPAQAGNTSPAMLRHLQVGRASDVGKVRSHNEDALLTIESTFEGDQPLKPFGLFIIADGMGGHLAGEVASSLATRIVASRLMRDVYTPYLLEGRPTSDQVPLAEALQV